MLFPLLYMGVTPLVSHLYNYLGYLSTTTKIQGNSLCTSRLGSNIDMLIVTRVKGQSSSIDDFRIATQVWKGT